MLFKDFINIVKDDVAAIHRTEFNFEETNKVPSVEDNDLTFGNGEEKKGSIINTCVLFVDIRNSVQLNGEHYTKTMGRIYTAFTNGVLKAARLHNGVVRNIIGDRVMIVFQPEMCFKNAVDCAVSINHIAKLISAEFAMAFRVGIGIDYGKMNVIKVGIIRRGQENVENKNLVWVGWPANIASRLTDVSGKEIKEVKYKVRRLTYYYQFLKDHDLFNRPSGWYPQTETIGAEEVADLVMDDEKRNKVESIKKVRSQYLFPPILVSQIVYDGLVKETPNRNSVIKGWWIKQATSIKDIDFDVYGADLHWMMD